MNEKHLNSNISKYYGFQTFFNLLIIGPILVPYLLFKGLNYTQILLLQAIASTSIFFFEVPTGAIADKISRKFSLIISTFFIFISLFLYIIGKNFYLFMTAEILFGLGFTFMSGADSAILFQTLKLLGRSKDYQKIDGKAQSNVFLAQALGSLVSSILYTYNPYLPWIISMFNIIVSLIFALGFHEPQMEKSEHRYLFHILKSASLSVKNMRIVWIFIFAVFTGFLAKSGFWMYEPYFKGVGIPVFYYGMIFMGFNIIAALSSRLIIPKIQHIRPRKILLAILFLLFLSFFIPGIGRHWIFIPIIALQQIFRGIYSTTLRFYINLNINDQYRATVLSLVSLIANLSFAILSAAFLGRSLDIKGPWFTYIWVGLFAFIGWLVSISLRKWQKKLKN